MNMQVNLDTSVNNLLYLEYMGKHHQKEDTKSNEDQKEVWYKQVAPQDKKEN